MEKIIHSLINNWIKGVDTYTHNGSTWLIFTDSKKWVIELTDSKTLWYNYNFFKQIFEFTSLDVVDNQQYITKWVEDNLINTPKCTEPVEHTRNAMTKDTIKYGVKDTILEKNITEGEVDDIIQDGVKETSSNVMMFQSMKVEDTIQNGVKETITSELRLNLTSENIIKNGVKHTEIGWHQCNNIDDAIEKGVKETMFNQGHKQLTVKNIIENGVKEIYDYKGHRWDVKDVIQDGVRDISPMTQYTDWQVEEIIENGVKNIRGIENDRSFFIEDTLEMGVKHTGAPDWNRDKVAEYAIENGVQETKGDASQNPMGKVTKVIKNGINKSIAAGYEHPNSLVYVKWPDEIDDVIEKGIKETNHVDVMKFFDNKMEDTLQNGVKETNHIKNNVRETKQFEEHLADTIDAVINEGVKETSHKCLLKRGEIEDIIDGGVKHTQERMVIKKSIVDDAIENGVKETKNAKGNYTDDVEDTIKNGVKETKTPGKDGDILSTVEWMEENNSSSYTKMINDVIENGVKEIRPSGCVDPKTRIFHYRIQEQVDDVVDNGEKVNGTFVGGKRQKENIESVIGYGTKNPTD